MRNKPIIWTLSLAAGLSLGYLLSHKARQQATPIQKPTLESPFFMYNENDFRRESGLPERPRSTIPYITGPKVLYDSYAEAVKEMGPDVAGYFLHTFGYEITTQPGQTLQGLSQDLESLLGEPISWRKLHAENPTVLATPDSLAPLPPATKLTYTTSSGHVNVI